MTARSRPESVPREMSDEERRLAWEWADGRWLGDSWFEHLRRALESEAHFLAETERLRAALREIDYGAPRSVARRALGELP